MLDVTVKTLDGLNKNYSIPDEMTVKEFKDKISASINIPSDTQRLIFHGKVLQDDKALKEYDVNGKVIHVVQRAPPTSRSDNFGITSTTTSTGAAPRSVVVGSFTLPTDVLDPNQVQNIVQSAVAGMGDQWRNARVSTSASTDGSPIDVRISLGNAPSQQIDQTQTQVSHIRRLLRQVTRLVETLEDPATSDQPTVGATGPDDSNMETSADSSPSPDTNQDSPIPDNSTATENTSNQPSRPRTSVLADILQEVTRLTNRFQPYLDEYRNVLQNILPIEEAQPTQRMCNVVAEVLHGLSHIYHGISDFMIDVSAAPPRSLYSPPSSMVAIPAMVQRTQINVSNGRPNTQNASDTRTSQSTSTPSSSTTPSTSVSSTSTSTTAQTQTTSSTGPQPTAVPPNLTNLPPGVTVTGSSDPYVFVEVGPESVTLNSISAHVITSSHDNGTTPISSESFSTTTTDSSGPQTTSASSAATNVSTSARTFTTTSMGPDLNNIPGVPPGFMQNFMQSVLQGGRPRHPVQINVVPLNLSNAGGGPIRVSGVRPMANIPPSSIEIRMLSRAPAPPSSANLTSTSTTTSTGSTTSSTSASTTTTRSTTSTSASSQPGAAPQLHRHQFTGAGLPPGVSGVGVLPGRPVDPYLPCGSRHYLAQHARNAAGAPGQANPEAGLAEMVSGLMSGILGGQPGQPHIHVHHGPLPPHATRPSAPSSQPAASTEQPGPAPTPMVNPFVSLINSGVPVGGESDSTSSPNQPPFVDILRNVMGAGVPPSTGGTETGTAPAPTGENSDAVFVELFGGISQQIAGAASGNQSNDTISDFLGHLTTNHNIAAGEGFLNDLFRAVSEHMTFSDLFGIFMGRTENLGRLQEPLKVFFRDRVLKGKEYNEDNLRAAIEEIIIEMEPELQPAIACVQVKEDIDLMSTFNNFLRQQLRATIRLVLNSEDGDSNFGRNIYERVRRLLGEFVVLTPCCLVNGNTAFEHMLQNRLQSLTASMNPMLQQWMVTMTSQQVQSFRQTVVIRESEIQHYIVRRGATTAAGNAAMLRANQAEVPMEVGSPPSATSVPMTSTSKTAEQSNKATKTESKSRSTPSSLPARGSGVVNGSTSTGVTSPTPGLTAKSVDSSTNGENWTAVVPEEWVPIINQDIQRQKQNRPQPPLSDAYLQGLPAKRRRVMTSDRPSNSLTNMAEYIPESIRHSASNLGIEPISNVDNLTEEASCNSDLQIALNSEIDRVIVNRLEKDSDYIAERYPNADQQYKPKKRDG